MARDRLHDVLERWEAVIGLEIHTELTSLNSKMFCGCPVEFGGEPNTRVCPVCLGLPGSLPVPNGAAIESTVLAGLATNCEVAKYSLFHRKNYFYPDMPKDYQISQYDLPFCSAGYVWIDVEGEGATQALPYEQWGSKRHEDSQRAPHRRDWKPDKTAGTYRALIGITRIHLEEDTGKMVHVGGSEGRLAGATHSLVDFNRAGTGLIELVSEPDIRTPEEARRFAQQLRLIWLALGISDCNMEEGSMRVDANVSVRKRGTSAYGVKAEVKNMNSFKALHDALAHEIVRQAETIEDGGKIIQETRHWDAGARRTSSLRTKEEAHDYRYFPEPDMVPFEFSDQFVDCLREKLPELPEAKRARFVSEYGLSAYEATVLTSDAGLAEFYQAALTLGGVERAKPISNWVLNDLSAHLNERGIEVAESKVVPSMVVELVELVDDGTISSRQAKDVFAEMAESGDSPAAIIELRGMRQVSDAGAIEEVVDRVLAANPEEVEAYRGGKVGLIGFFVGQVMREMGGQANPGMVNEVLRQKLAG